jgi:hypothetical protein
MTTGPETDPPFTPTKPKTERPIRTKRSEAPQPSPPPRSGQPSGYVLPVLHTRIPEPVIPRTVHLPVLGEKTLADAAFLAVVGAFAAFELIDWPIAVILGLGKLMVDHTHSRILKAVGEGMEEAG